MTDLFQAHAAESGPVECLGQTFPNDAARREHFLAILREKLQDPEFRKIEGFPIGTDEDILALSDPPYYTACPNPFLDDFVRHYGKPYDPNVKYAREPLAVDVSVGKTDPIYKAHAYHTKVPHLAIVPSILHYTEPGDLVLDGFAGSGMTGVAAQWCGSAPAAYRHELETEWKKQGRPAPKWGARRAILNDLSPAATFIAANYNLPFDVEAFAQAGKQLLKEVEEELGWMYETLHVEPASSRLKNLTGFHGVGLASCQPSLLETGSTKPKINGITEFTKRKDNLPHWQLPGSFYFLTFNTENHRELSSEARQIVLDALRFFDGKRLDFIAAVVMPDHVHAVIKPLPKVEPASSRPSQQDAGLTGTVYWDLSDLMHSIKSFSANQINKLEEKVGQTVWQTETYDRIIRDDMEFGFTLQYIAYNPVRAGLTKTPEEYPWFVVGGSVRESGWKPAPRGRIEYTVWSEVFTCPHCAGEVNFLDEALDGDSKRVKETFPCPHCSADLNKDNLERVLESRIDPATGEAWKRIKLRPTLIIYIVGGKEYEKHLDQNDIDVLTKIEALPLPPDLPTAKFPVEQMYHGSRIEPKGFSRSHHFFLPRAAQMMARLWSKAKAQPDSRLREILLFFVEQAIWGMSVLARYAPTHFSQVNQYLNGVYYVGSQHAECSPWYILEGKLSRLTKSFRNYKPQPGLAAINTGTTSGLPVPNGSIDYVFTDPPFGENIFYADLNFLVESWHRVITDAQPEAIVDKFKKKGLPEYQHLMQRCFAEYFRVLKPGRWMTVVFSNSKAAVWNTIQVALQQAGFVVAEVTALDKVQGSYRQVTSTTAVKQDLVISAYKPNGGLEDRFSRSGASVESAWDFVQTHLRQLPGVKTTYGEFPELVKIVERDPRRIYDRMASWFIRHDKLVPISTPEFLAELPQRFAERDGMIFLPDQVVEYDKKRMQIPQARQVDWRLSPSPATSGC
jgi:DNA modification methylase/REP element-mobilizing transposase RayT